ncbi:hypothetical protein [Streptomyces sp. NBC_01800]|uniref:hypothetical protein n=1 Tax=Streptomyces sp. NBC_01800 TaxID=2975945 RepID=UPI002DD9A3F3|nr:hypothetical protein [Streptomyces sp. NBC_01800]WSA68786.1 hypothetical protein OIE65_18370 [Streptomyces sp. NBC_01800]
MTNQSALTREEVPIAIESDGMELRVQEIGGGMVTAFVRLPAGADLGPAMVGLPDDLCQCPHWGYVQKGRVGLRTKNGEEVYEAGQAFHWSPGHAPYALEDAEYVDFSPTTDFTVLVEHFMAQLG